MTIVLSLTFACVSCKTWTAAGERPGDVVSSGVIGDGVAIVAESGGAGCAGAVLSWAKVPVIEMAATIVAANIKPNLEKPVIFICHSFYYIQHHNLVLVARQVKTNPIIEPAVIMRSLGTVLFPDSLRKRLGQGSRRPDAAFIFQNAFDGLLRFVHDGDEVQVGW